MSRRLFPRGTLGNSKYNRNRGLSVSGAAVANINDCEDPEEEHSMNIDRSIRVETASTVPTPVVWATGHRSASAASKPPFIRAGSHDSGDSDIPSCSSGRSTGTPALRKNFGLWGAVTPFNKEKNSNHSQRNNNTADEDQDSSRESYNIPNPLLKASGGGNASPHSNHAILHATTLTSGSMPPAGIFSHTYEPDESEVWRAYTAKVHDRNRHQWWTVEQEWGVKRWILTFLIGVLQAVIATSCNFATRYLSTIKYEAVHPYLVPVVSSDAVDRSNESGNNAQPFYDDWIPWGYETGMNPEDYESSGEQSTTTANLWSAFLVFLSYQTIFGVVASSFVWYEPASGGSGIPEVKCFLNGIDMPRLLTVPTLICKLVGITFSVAAGFPIGMEGPMVHSGSIVGALVCQGGQSCNRKYDLNNRSRQIKCCWSRTGYTGTRTCDDDENDNIDNVDTDEDEASFGAFSEFRNDREKRDFVACGAAAGVCSAFGSPIGGVLFSLEEASSFFSTKLTWYVIAMTAK